MPPGGAAGPGASSFLRRGSDLILPFGFIASVLVILAPLPPGLLDVLLSINICVAVIMLLTTIYVRTPLEFSIFPSLLLTTPVASTFPRSPVSMVKLMPPCASIVP